MKYVAIIVLLLCAGCAVYPYYGYDYGYYDSVYPYYNDPYYYPYYNPYYYTYPNLYFDYGFFGRHHAFGFGFW